MLKDQTNKKYCLNLTGAADFLNVTNPKWTTRKLCPLKKQTLSRLGGKWEREKHEGTTPPAALAWVPCVEWRHGVASLQAQVYLWGEQIIQIELRINFDPIRAGKHLIIRAFKSHRSALNSHKNCDISKVTKFPCASNS